MRFNAVLFINESYNLLKTKVYGTVIYDENQILKNLLTTLFAQSLENCDIFV